LIDIRFETEGVLIEALDCIAISGANEYFAFCFAYAAVKTDALAVDQQPIAADTETDLFDLVRTLPYERETAISSDRESNH